MPIMPKYIRFKKLYDIDLLYEKKKHNDFILEELFS